MRTNRVLSVLIMAGFVCLVAAPGESQSGRVAKKAAKEATKDAAGDAAKDATKDATKKALAPDAIDLNAASPDMLKKLGLDDASAKKLIEGRPYSSLDDAKLKEAIPADTLKKLEGKVTVKPPAK